MGAAPNSPPDARKVLLSVYQRALEAVHGRPVVRRALTEEMSKDSSRTSWLVIAIGKAAAAMTLGALDVLGDRVAAALVVSRDGHFDPALEADLRVLLVPAGHPLPDERSAAAGEQLLQTLKSCPPDWQLLFLVSGGASSLVEVPKPGLSLQLIRRWNEWAQSSPLGIDAVNAVRTRLSAIKGGQLLRHLRNETLALFISDVPGDDPDVIGSGLLGEARELLLPPNLPEWIRPHIGELGEKGPSNFRIRRRVVATMGDALEAAQRAGEGLGLRVKLHPKRYSGPALGLATGMCHELVLGSEHVHIWGGESVVQLPASPGRGGRNQHLALAAARLLVSHPSLALLAAGTDGTDGSSPDAGAIVDSETIERGTLDGLDVDDCLRRADSGTFLEAAGDLLHTGPTGTNVGDLVLGLKT